MKQQLTRRAWSILINFVIEAQASSSCNAWEDSSLVGHSSLQDNILVSAQLNEVPDAISNIHNSSVGRKRPNPSTVITSDTREKYERCDRSNESRFTSPQEELSEPLCFSRDRRFQQSESDSSSNSLNSKGVGIGETPGVRDDRIFMVSRQNGIPEGPNDYFQAENEPSSVLQRGIDLRLNAIQCREISQTQQNDGTRSTEQCCLPDEPQHSRAEYTSQHIPPMYLHMPNWSFHPLNIPQSYIQPPQYGVPSMPSMYQSPPIYPYGSLYHGNRSLPSIFSPRQPTHTSISPCQNASTSDESLELVVADDQNTYTGSEELELGLSPDQRKLVEDELKEGFSRATSSKGLFHESGEIDVENYVKFCKSTIFADEKFIQAYEYSSAKKSIVPSVDILRKYLALKRNICSLRNVSKLWAYLNTLLIEKSNGDEICVSKAVLENPLFPYFCLAVMNSRSNASMFKCLYSIFNKTVEQKPQHGAVSPKAASSSRGQVYEGRYSDLTEELSYFKNSGRTVINDINVLDTISNAVKILAAEESKRLIFDNLKRMFRYEDIAPNSILESRMMYFMCVYRAICNDRFLDIVRGVISNVSKAMSGEDEKTVQIRSHLENELKIYCSRVHCTICDVFNDIVLPYLDGVTDKGENMQTVIQLLLSKRKSDLTQHISIFLDSILVKIDSASPPNIEEIKFSMCICAQGLINTSRAICDLVFLLCTEGSGITHRFTVGPLFGCLVISQFDPKRVEILLEEYTKHMRVQEKAANPTAGIQ